MSSKECELGVVVPFGVFVCVPPRAGYQLLVSHLIPVLRIAAVDEEEEHERNMHISLQVPKNP